LYLSGEAGIFNYYIKEGVKPYYFQMDVCDGDLTIFKDEPKIHDVIFTGSCVGQGHRIEWLKEINKVIPVKIWAWNYQDWEKLGLEAYPAIYGDDYNRLIAQSKVILGFSVEPNCWGYFSNRIGKTLAAGGNLLQEYGPGMEQVLPSTVEYFNSPQEAIEKINKMIESNKTGEYYPQFTSKEKIRQLSILMERYLKGDPSKWNQLPK